MPPVFSTNHFVKVVRGAGTPKEQVRENVRAGGLLDEKGLFLPDAKMKRGDVIEAEHLDEPRVVVAVHPVLTSSGHSHDTVDLVPLSAYREARREVSTGKQARPAYADIGREKAMALLRQQVEGIAQIAELPFDHPDVEEWERKTASVLRAVFGEQDDRAFHFLQLAQTEEFSPYAELSSDETEGDEVKHARLLAKRRSLLREALFSLEHLSPRPFEPEGYALHPEIERVAGKLYQNGHFRQAAHDAYIRVIEEVKTKTGLLDNKGKPLDGIPLMRQAFDCENNKTPPVRFNDLKTESERDEQQGFMHLFLGLVRLRHSKAHSVRPFDDPSRAHEYLCLASLLVRLLDMATVEPAGSEGPGS